MKLRTRGRFNLKPCRARSPTACGTEFDRVLRAAARDGRREFVFAWNRGLGDIALGSCRCSPGFDPASAKAESSCSRAPTSQKRFRSPASTRSTSYPE
jgi:hypothetical protein